MTTSETLSLHPPVPATRAADLVGWRLEQFFHSERRRWRQVNPALCDLVDILRRFVEGGGKRLRASFCYWGWRAAASPVDPQGSVEDDGPAVDVAAALELLHAFALIHDDVMDGSTLRRGQPTLHEEMKLAHASAGWRGERRRFGEGMAVLVGDAALSWADCLLSPHRAAVGALWDELRVELTMGQYLDIVDSTGPRSDPEAAWLVAALKSGRYTVMRPLQLGAAVAGRLHDLGPVYASFGGPIGEAFQMRDDLLGVYGDPAETGKPAGEDLRQGKATVLVAIAAASAPSSAQPLLDRLGCPDLEHHEIERLRSLFQRCGATDAVERAIASRVNTGLAALDSASLTDEGRRALTDLAQTAAWRSR